MKREDTLEKAKELISSDRAKIYGDALENHKRIAMMWTSL